MATSKANENDLDVPKPDSEASEALVSRSLMSGTEVSASKRAKLELERHEGARDNDLDGNVAGVVPSPVFNLLSENWDKVLPLSATDFLALINSSSYWRTMFKSKIANELLPLVLPVLLNNLSYGVTPVSLLCWRGVSHQSKALVDELLEKALSPQKYYDDLTTNLFEWSPSIIDDEYPIRSVVLKISRYHLALNQGRLQQLMTRSSYSRPAILNLVIDQEYVGTTLELFTQYGHNLTDLCLHLAFLPQNLFFELLSLTPNLNVLQLNGDMESVDDEDGMPDVQQLSRLRLLDIESFLNFPLQLPRAPSILRICGPYLERLICNTKFLNEHENDVRLLNSGSFPNLSCLRLGTSYGDTSFDTLHRLQNHPLQKLQLYVNCYPDTNYAYDFQPLPILSAVNTFANTLTHLQLFLNVVGRVPQSRLDGFLPFQRLRKLSTWLPNLLQNWFWPFIQSKCQNLEELRLHTQNWNEEEINVDQLRRGFELLPRLDKIVVFCGFHQVARSQHGKMPEKVVISRDAGILQRKKYSFATRNLAEEEDI
ncbi:hypothetical protein Ocin01_18178 [Orchesella cincta]|uniref:F-box domain-containing protein n=1 Tax=Orchesella cincta TaxID=48709 RepID=A0A1D2M6B2_ORCCI|nr:hypothetical protein Ocin01_18178 [Orchesella cincta]